MTVETDKVEAKEHDRRRTRAFVIVVVVAFVVTFIQGYSLNATHNLASDTHDLAVSNKALLQADADQRAANRDRFAQSDRALCLAVEKLKAERRKAAIKSYHDLDRNLRVFHLAVTPEIRAIARKQRDERLAEFKARKGGCGTLPSTGVKKGPAETGTNPRPVVTTSTP